MDRAPPPYDRSSSDGCSGGVRQLGRDCCVDHDQRYWLAKTWIDKLRADALLGWCLARHGWRECRAHRQPYTAMVGWVALGVGRSLAVALCGWGPWLRARKRAEQVGRNGGASDE